MEATLTVIGKKQRAIGTNEAALLTAWKKVMDAHGWAESLMCVDCYQNHEPNTFCHCATIPGKSITINCACTERTWQGISK
jgi:hypothetical protein